MRRAAAATLALLWCTNAAAFAAFMDPSNNTQPVRWAGPTVDIRIQQDGVDDVSDGSDLQAIRRGLAAWNTAMDGRLTLVEGGTGGSRAYGNDGVNRITFLESGWPSAADGALGTTLPHLQGGTVVDADVLLNGQEGTWTTNGNPLGIDVQSVATHETGHLLGLWHAAQSNATMYSGTRRGSTFRSALADDDLRAARFIAPSPPPCGTDADCPLLVGKLGGSIRRLSCQGGSCVGGQAGYGSDCLQGGHCASGQCLGDPAASDGDDPGACTQTCGSCPNGDVCTNVNGTNVCAPGHGCLGDADCPGGNNDVCLLAFDGRYTCTHLCLRDAHCINGGRCIDLGYGAGVCQTGGALANGQACQHALECQGLACSGSGAQRTCSVAPPRDPADGQPDASVPPQMDASVPRDASVQPDAAGPQPDGGGVVMPGLDGGGVVSNDEDGGTLASGAWPGWGGTLLCSCREPAAREAPWGLTLMVMVMGTLLMRRRRHRTQRTR